MLQTRFSRFRFGLLAIALLLAVRVAPADESGGALPAAPAVAAAAISRIAPAQYQSRRVLVHTDLPAGEAEELIARLEEMLDFTTRYWGRESRRRIECYVVDDLKNWQDTSLPHPLAKIIVGGVSGGVVGEAISARQNAQTKAIVYASSRRGVVEHEIVHAYCKQNFGSTGPNWYREGMAELAVMECLRENGVACSAQQIAFLRDVQREGITSIVDGGDFGRNISASLDVMLADPKNRDRHVPLSDWTDKDEENVRRARDEYLRSWALCYMLHHNPNYSTRFRTLGVGYLGNKDAFNDLLRPMQREIAFEFEFFLKHIAAGYRVDLCSWEWDKQFRPLERGATARTGVTAARGYQATGVSLVRGERYAFHCDGQWKTSSQDEATSADGDLFGRGRLVGAIMSEYALSEPFPLGSLGAFVAPADGDLYLRCDDDWQQLHDNDGVIRAQFVRLD